MTRQMNKQARFRFYEELNDFLPADFRKKTFPYSFFGKPSVKDAIEAIGVPHPEIELILVNGVSVGFNHALYNGDLVSVYPRFESFDVTPLIRLRRKPLRRTAFVLDVHLGTLARLLRMLGFNAYYRNDFQDAELVRISLAEKRILLTRDRTLLRHGSVTHAYWLRSQLPKEQTKEVLERFDLYRQIHPFKRCLECNGMIHNVDKQAVIKKLPQKTAAYYKVFFQCESCKRVYWKGSHYVKLKCLVSDFRKKY